MPSRSVALPLSRPGPVIAVLAFAGTTAAVMQTLITPLLTQLPQILSAKASDTAWVVTATLLAGAVGIPVSGRLGDLLGKRRVLLACCLPLVVGCVVCATASTLAVMVAGRALQGLGMGLVPVGIAALRDLVPDGRRSAAIALVSASMGIGGGLGLPLAAAVAQFANWRLLFWGAAVLCLVVAGLVAAVVPEVPGAARGGRFDLPGAVGLSVVLVCLLLGVSKGADWGWASPAVLGLLAAAAVALAAWVPWELRTDGPLVDLRVAARPRVLVTNLASVFIGVGMYAMSLVAPQLLQLPVATGYGLGADMLGAGLWLLPGGVVMMLLSPLGGRLVDARGPRAALVLGAAVCAAGYVAAQVLMGAAWGVMLAVVVVNAGVALAYGAMPALIMSAVPRSGTASATGLNTLMRSVGTTCGAAVVGVVLSHLTRDLGGTPVPSETGVRVVLWLGAAVCAVAAVVGACVPGAPAADAGSSGAGAPAAGPAAVPHGTDAVARPKVKVSLRE